MAMIVLLVFLVSNTCHVSGNRDIIGSGYSIQNGNPDGVNPISGGLDPGILHDRKILQTEGYPQAVIRDLEQTCRRSESVEWYYSPFSYQEKLRQSIKAFGNGNVKLREMAFTKSPQFLHYVQNTFGHNDVVQEIIKTCSFGNTRYAVDIVDCKHFTVTDAFAADVCSLNSSYDFDQYKSFLDRWGTHVIVEAEFGMKTITRYKINDVELFKIVLENVPEAVLETDNSSRTIDFNVFSSSPYFSTAINEFSENLTIGTKKEPLPIALRIMSIDTIIQTKFWSKVDSLIQRGICAEGTKLSDILAKQKHLKTALAEVAETNYTPLYSRKHKVVVPVEWPLGTYVFPGVSVDDYYRSASCPGSSSEGWLSSAYFQFATQNAGNNEGSFRNEISAKLTDNYIKLNFCSKLAERNTRYDLDWPAGDYCIYKYLECPKGFEEGSVVWGGKSNRAEGRHPDIKYLRSEGVEVFFCCRNDSNADAPIYLPRNEKFYLLRNAGSSKCQDVSGMMSKEEYLKWDTDDSMSLYSSDFIYARNSHPMVDVSNRADITLHFCLYKMP